MLAVLQSIPTTFPYSTSAEQGNGNKIYRNRIQMSKDHKETHAQGNAHYLNIYKAVVQSQKKTDIKKSPKKNEPRSKNVCIYAPEGAEGEAASKRAWLKPAITAIHLLSVVITPCLSMEGPSFHSAWISCLIFSNQSLIHWTSPSYRRRLCSTYCSARRIFKTKRVPFCKPETLVRTQKEAVLPRSLR